MNHSSSSGVSLMFRPYHVQLMAGVGHSANSAVQQLAEESVPCCSAELVVWNGTAILICKQAYGKFGNAADFPYFQFVPLRRCRSLNLSLNACIYQPHTHVLALLFALLIPADSTILDLSSGALRSREVIPLLKSLQSASENIVGLNLADNSLQTDCVRELKELVKNKQSIERSVYLATFDFWLIRVGASALNYGSVCCS